MSIGLRYRAGAMGVPFMPMRSMMGSDVAGQLDNLEEMTCPFTGEKILLVPALNPDVALIHVQRCDPFGNAQIDGLTFMDIDMAMAANRVILTTERIISNDQIRRRPDQTKSPSSPSTRWWRRPMVARRMNASAFMSLCFPIWTIMRNSRGKSRWTA